MASINPKPRSFLNRKLNKIWIQTANSSEFRDPKVLWNELWSRYNTQTISLLDENAFFADALCIAKHAKDRQELEDLLAKKMKERREELRVVLDEIGLAVLYHKHKLESEAASWAALKITRTTSLDSFLQFVGGSMFGWAGEPLDQRKQIRKAPGRYGDADQDVTHNGEEQSDDEPPVDNIFTQRDSDFDLGDWSSPSSTAELLDWSSPSSTARTPPRDHGTVVAATATASKARAGARATFDAGQPAVTPNIIGGGRTNAPGPAGEPLSPEAVNISTCQVSQPLSPPLLTRSLSAGVTPDAPITPPWSDVTSTVSPASTDEESLNSAPISQSLATNLRLQHSTNDSSTSSIKQVNASTRALSAESAAGRPLGQKRRRDEPSYSVDASNDEHRCRKRRMDVFDPASPSASACSARHSSD